MSEILPYIFVASFATILTRFLPYILFNKKTQNPTLAYLQKKSGLLIMTILTLYAFKEMLPQNLQNLNAIWVILFLTICLVLSFILHAKYRNSLITIVVPTLIYMVCLKFFL